MRSSVNSVNGSKRRLITAIVSRIFSSLLSENVQTRMDGQTSTTFFNSGRTTILWSTWLIWSPISHPAMSSVSGGLSLYSAILRSSTADGNAASELEDLLCTTCTLVKRFAHPLTRSAISAQFILRFKERSESINLLHVQQLSVPSKNTILSFSTPWMGSSFPL